MSISINIELKKEVLVWQHHQSDKHITLVSTNTSLVCRNVLDVLKSPIKIGSLYRL
jgi:hypothetical protein